MGDTRGENGIAVGRSEDETPDLLTGLRNGAWLDANVFPPLSYAVPGLFPQGSTLLVGAPKIGKSWLGLGLALAVGAGDRALGCLPVDKRPVLYLALEDGERRLQDRCRTLLGDDPIPVGFEYLTTVTPGLVVPTIDQWLQRHREAYPLVILDTLGKVMPAAQPGESAYQRDYRIGGTLKWLVDEHPGSSLVTNHHDRKAGSDDFVDAVSGTHGLAGAADTIITLTRARHESSGLLRVTGRDVAEGEYALTFYAGGAWRLDGMTLGEAAAKATNVRVTAGLGDRSTEILAFVARHPDGVRAAEVEAVLGADARRYLARLAEAGRLLRPRRGLYAPVPTVTLSQGGGAPMGQRDTWDMATRRCHVCGEALDPTLVASGETTHPSCDPEGIDA